MSNRYSLDRTTRFRYSWLLLVAFLFSTNVWSQVSAYTFAQSTGTYTPITGGTVLATAAAGGNQFDSQVWTIASGSFPFSFVYNGNSFTGCYVSSNGFITFGTAAPSAFTTTPLSTTIANTSGKIAALAGDLNTFGNIGGRFGEVRWEVVGTAPNREVVIQLSNWRAVFQNSATVAYSIDFQYRLGENGSINIVYGNMGIVAGAPTGSGTRQIGLGGATTADFNNRLNAVGTAFTASTAGVANNSSQAINLVTSPPGMPTNGLTYTWSPPLCQAPSGIVLASVTTSSATFNWNAAFTSNIGYEWELRTSGAAGSGATGLISSGSGNVLTQAFTGLAANTTHTLYVRTNCDANGFSAWSAGVNALTGYCVATSTAGTSFISNVVSAGATTNLSNASGGFSAGGYGDFTSQLLEVQQGTSFTLNISVNDDVEINVFIDWNNDLDFNDVGELVAATTAYQPTTPSTYTSSGIAVALSQALGTYRMRIATDWNSGNPAACGNLARGEREDYTVTVLAAPACLGPNALTATAISETGATLGWTPQGTETLWDIEYGTAGFTQGTGTLVDNHNASSYVLSGLTAGTAYQFYVRADCGGTQSPWTGPFAFNTVPLGDNCSNVINLDLLTSPLSSTTVGAAADFSFACNANASPDLIYSITVLAGQVLTIGQTVNGYDSENYVFYGGACPGTTQIACFDDPDIQNITWTNTTGSTQTVYWIQDGFSSAANVGTFTLAWSIPLCPAPSAGAASAITASSANLSWTAGASETAWDIEYGLSGFTLGTGTQVTGLTATSYALTGLTGGASYQVYYRANCGATQSSWSGPINFTTTPPNDNCSNALDLATLTSPYSSSTSGTTNDFTNTCAGGNTSPDVVFFIDVPNGFELTIGQTVNGYDSENTVFYGGACPGETQIACFDDPDIQNVVWGNTTGSTQRVYWVQDGYFGPTNAGTYTLAWSLAALPPCGNPTVSGVNPVFNGVSFTINAGGLGTPVGYEYEIVADLAPPTGVGTSSVSNAISATGLSPTTAYDLYVRTNCGVDGFSAWVGPISFTTPNPPPVNDECANAIPISCLATPVAGTTVDATVDTYIDAGAGGSLTAQRGVWYVITGDDNQYTINTCSAVGYDTRISVYSGSCGALTGITGNDDMGAACSSFSTLRSQVSFGAFAGTNYYVFVHGYEGGFGLSATGAFELNISCSALCIPDANDACANAIALTPASTCVYTTGDTECSTNTVGLANPAGVSAFATYNDIWYTITPTTTDFYLNFAYGTATLLRYTLYTGTCGALVATPVNGIAPESTDLGVFGATIGQTYYLRVGADQPAFGTAGTDGTFDVCVRSIPCSTPTSATVTATSQTNVNVVINGGVEGDAYIIEYGPAGHVPGIDGTAGAGGTIVTTNTLNTNVAVAAEANYTFYVRKDCSGSADGYSFNVGPYNVSTFIVVPFSGTSSVTGCGITIYDHAGTGNYSNGANGTLVVNPTPGTLLQISGTIDTESGWDFVTIYDGAGTGGAVLFDGSGVGTVNVSASAPSSPLTIEFTSDGSGTDVGFQLTTTCLPACTATQGGGTVNGPSSVCAGASFTLTASNQNFGNEYTWQRRTSTTSWVTIPGETGPTLTTTQSVASIYRVRIGCAFDNINSSSPSAPINVDMTPFNQCYCASSYTLGTSDNDAITNVTLGSIDNTTGSSADPFVTTYAPAPGTTTNLAAGAELAGSVAVSSDFGDVAVAVWIDFNRNGSYEPSERVTQSPTDLVDGDIHSFNVVVPPTSSLGTTGMRVRVVYNNANIDPCTNYTWGETENYTVTIVPGSANDARPNAQVVAPALFPGCTNITGNLANATPSQGTPGNDLWYSFIAGSNAVRIQLVGAEDCEIELENAAGTTLTSENATTANGNEVLAFDGLTVGTQYWVAVRSMNGNPSSFSCCIQSLNDSRCDNGPIFSSLCNTFKVDWTGTANYVVRFTETAAPNATYTYNMNGVTSVPLRLITGLEHNRTYDVSVDAVYTIVDAGGNTSTVTATSNETCPITITQHPLTNLRAIDRDPATRAIGAFISTDVNVCAVTNWEWTFELVDNLGNPSGLEGPVSVLANTTSRFIRTSQIPNVLAGNRYRVRVRPIFASGPGVFDDLSFHYLRIAGNAGMVDVFDNTANPEEVYFERNTDHGVFAALYPNPNNGDMVNLNLAGIDSDNVNVRIMDASGRIVWTNRYVVEGALNTIIAFDRPLTSGIYLVEMTFDNQVITERMMVTK